MSEHLDFTISHDLWLTANGSRGTTRGGIYQRATITRQLRLMAKVEALAALAHGEITRHTVPCVVTVSITYPRVGRADPPNAYPTVKPLIDGLVDAGIWPDDNSAWIPSMTFTRSPGRSTPTTHDIAIMWEEAC